ncbi:Putative tartrate transporter [Methylobacterium crusticola]|uniref:Tartrate transporter n=1 Tax=Methylobacterium crusticola TaxID=1697972 RepID=A0ABQ4R713_9HYPH|nr:MFS transporter [Methylobacterium crusticola]GJD53126.1 Putative tartrate transporter [Methylobacterium crusticola]
MKAANITGASGAGAAGDDAIRQRVLSRLRTRIVLYCFVLFIINYLDRVNVGFAALHMNKDLGLSATAYGLGAGIFFLGYIAFEIPSNMIMHRVGPRRWIARIMVSWGILSCAMAFVQGELSFYLMRFLLGLAEAGFVPGILLYLTYWFPARDRAKATAGFMTATVLSSVIGAPLSGWILGSNPNWLGLSAWQWLFILEGAPAIILGVVTYFYLADRPQDGRWLDAQERAWLVATIDQENRQVESVGSHEFRTIFRDHRVWLLTLIYMFNAVAVYGVVLWLPQIVRSIGGLSDVQTGLVTAIPFVFAAIGLMLVARSSDRTGERKWHTALSALAGGVFLAASALAPTPLVSLLLLCAAAFGVWAVLGVFWALPTQFLTGAAAAGGLAMINGFAQVGGFAGPYLVGWIRDATQSFTPALLTLAAGPVIAALLCGFVSVKASGIGAARSSPAE